MPSDGNDSEKVADRIAKQLPVFQKILAGAKDRDVNESDTVIIVTDMLADLFGFDKWTEVTSEFSIRGTFCDLAVKLDEKIRYLIEAKAIGLTLKENHLRQAIGYAANHGIPWIVLTNGIKWEIHRVRFEQPVSNELICSMDLLEMNGRRKEDVQLLYLLSREGVTSNAIDAFGDHVQYVNKFVVGAIIQSEPVLKVFRRELRTLSRGSKVTRDEIVALLPEVLKRDVMEGESAEDARKLVKRLMGKAAKKKAKKSTAGTAGPPSGLPGGTSRVADVSLPSTN